MSIRRIARYFAWGLLLAPIIVVALWLVITFLPGVAKLFGNVVWGILGEIPPFAQASAALQEWVTNSKNTVASFFGHLMTILFSSLSDALIMGCCVFLVKSCCTFFNQEWRGRFTRPEWLLTLGGVVLGVIACKIKQNSAGAWASLLTLIICLACFGTGIGMMLRGVNFTPNGGYHNRWAGFVINLMLGIVGNVFDALCGVAIVTVLFSGKLLLETGHGILPCLLWIVVACGLLVVKNAIIDLAQPNDT